MRQLRGQKKFAWDTAVVSVSDELVRPYFVRSEYINVRVSNGHRIDGCIEKAGKSRRSSACHGCVRLEMAASVPAGARKEKRDVARHSLYKFPDMDLMGPITPAIGAAQ